MAIACASVRGASLFEHSARDLFLDREQSVSKGPRAFGGGVRGGPEPREANCGSPAGGRFCDRRCGEARGLLTDATNLELSSGAIGPRFRLCRRALAASGFSAKASSVKLAEV